MQLFVLLVTRVLPWCLFLGMVVDILALIGPLLTTRVVDLDFFWGTRFVDLCCGQPVMVDR